MKEIGNLMQESNREGQATLAEIALWIKVKVVKKGLEGSSADAET